MRNAIVGGATFLLILLCATRPGRAERIDLETNLRHGELVSELRGDQGSGPIRVRGTNRRFGDAVNAAVIFDSANPTADDEDLGTPNSAFGGPGQGAGGRPGSMFENRIRRDNVLIVGENLNRGPDGLVSSPDDEGTYRRSRLSFDFSALGTVTISEIAVVDPEEGGRVEFLDSDGGRIAAEAIPETGNNGVFTKRFPTPISGVAVMHVELFGSGAVDIVEFARVGIDLEKATNGADADRADGADVPRIEPGGAVAWTYVVTNTGAVELSDVEVVDDRGVEVRCPADSLAPGASMTCRATGRASALEAEPAATVRGSCGGESDRPVYRNLGSVQGRTPDGIRVTDRDPSHYCTTPRTVPLPTEEIRIRIEKATNGADADRADGADVPQIEPGEPVEWTYVVTNVGEAALEGIEVRDDGGERVLCPRDRLAPGTSMTCRATGVAADLVAGSVDTVRGTCGGERDRPLYRNVGRASGRGPRGRVVTDDDPSHYCNGCRPSVSVRKLQVAASEAGAAGGPSFEIAVENTGCGELRNLVVADASASACNRSIERLAPGESRSFTCQATLTNEVCVDATTAGGEPVTRDCDAVVIEGRFDTVGVVRGPSLLGLRHRQAVEILGSLGLRHQTRTRWWSLFGGDRVLGQRPAPGEPVPADGEVEIEVAGSGCLYWLLPLLLLLLLAALIWYPLRWRRRDRVVLIGDKSPDAMELHRRDCSLLERVRPEDRVEIEGSRADERAIYRRGGPVPLLREWQARGFGLCGQCLRVADATALLAARVAQLQEQVSDRFGMTDRGLTEIQELLSGRVSTSTDGLRESVGRLQELVSERLGTMTDSVAKLQALVAERTSTTTEQLRENLARLHRELADRDSEASRRISELQTLVSDQASTTIEQLRERVATLRTDLSERDGRATERIAELQELVSERSSSSSREIADLQKLVSERSQSTREIEKLQGFILDRSSATTDRLTESIGELQTSVAERSAATTDRVLVRLAELQQLIADRDTVTTDRMLAKLVELQELVAKRSSATVAELGGRVAELYRVVEVNSATLERLERLLSAWWSKTTVSEAGAPPAEPQPQPTRPKRKTKKKAKKKAQKPVRRLLLIANTNSQELHRRDCRYGKRVSTANREEITGTARQETSFYERGVAPRALIARWVRQGYDGCAFCLKEYNREPRSGKTAKTATKEAAKRKRTRRTTKRTASRLLLVANTRSHELHRRDCRYAGRISAANREEILGTARQETSFYERGVVPRALIRRWMGRGYDGCAFCLEEYNRESGSGGVASVRKKGKRAGSKTVEAETVVEASAESESVEEVRHEHRRASRDESKEAE